MNQIIIIANLIDEIITLHEMAGNTPEATAAAILAIDALAKLSPENADEIDTQWDMKTT